MPENQVVVRLEDYEICPHSQQISDAVARGATWTEVAKAVEGALMVTAKGPGELSICVRWGSVIYHLDTAEAQRPSTVMDPSGQPRRMDLVAFDASQKAAIVSWVALAMSVGALLATLLL